MYLLLILLWLVVRRWLLGLLGFGLVGLPSVVSLWWADLVKLLCCVLLRCCLFGCVLLLICVV